MSYRVKAGSAVPREETFEVRCYCCRDTALIPADVLRTHMEEFGDYDDIAMWPNRPDAPVLCRRDGCKAIWTTIDTDQGKRQVYRYNPIYLNDRLPPAICQWLHEVELERVKAIVAQVAESKVLEPSNILPAMPTLPSGTAEPKPYNPWKTAAFIAGLDAEEVAS